MARKVLSLRWALKPARVLWVWYVRTLETRPLFTQAATTGRALCYVLPVLNESLEQLSRIHLRSGRRRGTAMRRKERQKTQLEKNEKHGRNWLPVHGRLATDPNRDRNSKSLFFACLTWRGQCWADGSTFLTKFLGKLSQPKASFLPYSSWLILSQNYNRICVPVSHPRTNLALTCTFCCMYTDALKKMLTDQVSDKMMLLMYKLFGMPLLQVLFAPVLFLCLLPLFGLSQSMSLPEIRSKMQKVRKSHC